MTDKQLLEQALEALEGVASMARCGQLDKFIGEPWLNAVFSAIEQAEKQEPVQEQMEKQLHIGWIVRNSQGKLDLLTDLQIDNSLEKYERLHKLYTTPPTQEFVCSTGLCHYKPAAPVQEPVAWMDVGDKGEHYSLRFWSEPDNRNEVPLYTTPPAAQRQWVGLNWLPKHKCGLHLSHNEHRDVYETIEQFYDADDFISEEEWHKAVAENSVWVLHWYPNTPVGFIRIAASTLEAIEAKLKEKNG